MYCLKVLALCGLVMVGATRISKKPNIVLFITDDQDVMLDSMSVMHHTRSRLTQKGVEFTNAFTTTPMCCPSRSSILTGLYTHNHHVYTNNDNCSSILWQRSHETKSYATYLNTSGYHTAYFGKYLNEYNGSYIPPGWRYWMGLAKNSKYYNYTLMHNGVREVHGDNFAKDYLTHLVTNRSMEFFRESKLRNPDEPILSVLSFPAPHGPEDSAPEYQRLYQNTQTHITTSFDHAPNPDKHWIIRRVTNQMDQTQMTFSQILQQKRLQTLRSVDDDIKRFTDMLQEMNELDNTYILYFSDHGYHIGQFGIPKGKSMPYDFDIRIPFMMRGPNVPQNLRLNKIALNIDIAPTILGIAGVPIPSEMDGRNLMDLFDQSKLENKPWRDSFLVERGKMPRDRAHLVKPKLQKENKLERLKKICALPNYKNPCEVGQFWTCVSDVEDKLRLQKCKKEKKQMKPRRKFSKKKMCPCPEGEREDGYDMDSELGDVPLQCGVGRKNGRKKVSKRNLYRHHIPGLQKGLSGAYFNLRKNGPGNKGRKRNKREADNFDMDSTTRNRSNDQLSKSKSMVLTSMCRLYMPNFEIRCLESLYHDPHEWVKHMGHLARSLKTYQIKMKYMKALLSCLNKHDKSVARDPPMCKCPTPSPKPKTPSNGNFSHPLEITKETEETLHSEQLREYQERIETKRMIKAMRQAKLARIQKREKKGVLRLNRCGSNGVTCFKLSNATWKTEPLWNGGDQCYCTNSNNNTYWCVRIINETTNVLYCEFITYFVEYYNLNDDPHQLVNYRDKISDEEHNALHNEMAQLRSCRGLDNCTVKRPPPSLTPPNEDTRESLLENQDQEEEEEYNIMPIDPVANLNTTAENRTPNHPAIIFGPDQRERGRSRRPGGRTATGSESRKKQVLSKAMAEGSSGRRRSPKTSKKKKQKAKTQEVQAQTNPLSQVFSGPQEKQRQGRRFRQRSGRQWQVQNSQKIPNKSKKNRKRKTSIA